MLADIQEYEEAFVVGGVGLVRPEHGADFLEGDQIDDVDVDLLGNGGRSEGILNDVTLWPGSAVHIQVPGVGEIMRI